MSSKLLFKVGQGEESVAGIKTLLVFTVTSPHFSVVPRVIRADELVTDTEISGGLLKKGLNIAVTVGKTVGELKTVVRLDTFYTDSPAGIPLHQPSQKVCGGVSGLLGIGGQETESGKLVNGCILEQAKLWIGDTAAGNYLHIYLETLTRIGHLLVGVGSIRLFLLPLWKHPQFPHNPK